MSPGWSGTHQPAISGFYILCPPFLLASNDHLVGRLHKEAAGVSPASRVPGDGVCPGGATT
jgi:hypothetical protein